MSTFGMKSVVPWEKKKCSLIWNSTFFVWPENVALHQLLYHSGTAAFSVPINPHDSFCCHKIFRTECQGVDRSALSRWSPPKPSKNYWIHFFLQVGIWFGLNCRWDAICIVDKCSMTAETGLENGTYLGLLQAIEQVLWQGHKEKLKEPAV